MIVTSIADPSRSQTGTRTRCLARRGMLYSECEAFDHLRLPPGGELGPRGREGIESAWFVLGGAGTARGASSRELRPGDLVLAPADASVTLVAGDEGLELLWLAVLPEAVTRALPARKPAVS
ncbi:cupin domain-containing protein [Amycolatopsis anabasis]|uniref:cupin domain-containing protein n=1 Tax=Amycolatopsis anabasis TaxID=1840409 RepID=UPI00131AB908|nr:cupin domain-containing protein [Amycolatopsis anabasis]